MWTADYPESIMELRCDEFFVACITAMTRTSGTLDSAPTNQEGCQPPLRPLLRQLCGIFCELQACEEIDIAWCTAYVCFPNALHLVSRSEASPVDP